MAPFIGNSVARLARAALALGIVALVAQSRPVRADVCRVWGDSEPQAASLITGDSSLAPLSTEQLALGTVSGVPLPDGRGSDSLSPPLPLSHSRMQAVSRQLSAISQTGAAVGLECVAPPLPLSPSPALPAPAVRPWGQERARSAGDAPVYEVPPPPGSASVALSGLLTLGAFGALRSAKNLNFSGLTVIPEWYHAGAPQQIGHTVAFDLGEQVLAVVWSDIPLADLAPQPVFRAHPRASDARCESQFLTPVTAPRGPPVRAIPT